MFQAIDVRKPVAAVSKIPSKGNRVVCDENGSYIEHKKIVRKMRLRVEHGAYVMEVEYLVPDVPAHGPQVPPKSGLRRPA